MSDKTVHVIVPYETLSELTIQNLLESYITREGTDYGQNELTIDVKLSTAKRDLYNGSVIIVWNIITESFQILTPAEYKKLENMRNNSDSE